MNNEPHDDNKAQIGRRLNGHTDPKDPDGLLTVDDPASVDQEADNRSVDEEPS